MDLQNIKIRLELLPSEIQKAGEEYAIAKGESEYIQEMRKVVYANSMNEYKKEYDKTGKKITNGMLELAGYINPKYTEYLEAMRQAIKEEHRTRAILESKRAEFESIRSLSSLEKIQMSLT